MIRDPSDGSVRPPLSDKSLELLNVEAKTVSSGPPVPSGLPTASTRPQMIAKLEKSREWLKNYHEQKGMK
jgi:hypothetical protein